MQVGAEDDDEYQSPDNLKEMIKEKFSDQFMLERSRLYARYGEKLPRRTDTIELQLVYPDCGWIDMHFKLNGEEKTIISASEVYEPFENIRYWLEKVCNLEAANVSIYDESDDHILYYEPLELEPYNPYYNYNKGPLGLFYLYDCSVKQIVADGVFKTRQFVRSLYESILNYAKESSKHDDFVEAWIEGAYNSEWGQYEDDNDSRVKEIFINKVTSPVVEKFLSGENRCHRDW